MADFSKMSEDELLRPDVSDSVSEPMSFEDMSEDELLKPDMAEGTATPPKPEGRALGFMERHEKEMESTLGREEQFAGEGLAYSVLPFYGTGTRAWEGKRQKALDKALETGEIGSSGDISSKLTGMEQAIDEWNATEGAKHDLYQRALNGDKDADYSPIWAKKFNEKTHRFEVDRDENGNPYLDDKYSVSKDEARKAYVKELAAEQIGEKARVQRDAQTDLANNTAPWYMGLAHGATASLGFAGEFALGGVVAKGVLGAAALSNTRLGLAAARAAQGAKLGWKGKTALTAAEVATPTVVNAVARYENLTANDYRMDDDGNVYLAEKGDEEGLKAATKAIGGAAFENATEVALGAVVNKTLGAACKGFYRKCPGVKNLFDGAAKKIGDKPIEAAKNAWFKASKTYADVQNAVHFELFPAGEFAEEYVQGFGDDVLGFDTRESAKTKSAGEFTKDFIDWDANGKDLFFGVMGQTIALGVGGHAVRRAKDFRNSIDSRVIGTLKTRYSNEDIAKMGTNTRLALAMQLSGGKALEGMKYGVRDYALFQGVNQSEVDKFVDNVNLMENKEEYGKLSDEQKLKLAKDVLQFNAVMYNSALAFENGVDGATELLDGLNKRMRKYIMLAEERTASGGMKGVANMKPQDFDSRVDWSGTMDSAGNINWQTDEKTGAQYIESRPIGDTGFGARIYIRGDKFLVVHPQGTNQNGYIVDDLKEAHDFAASLDQTAQMRNKEREVKTEFIKHNVQRLVPTTVDKKTGKTMGASVVIANDAMDAVNSFDWLSEKDKEALVAAAENGTEGGGFRASDGTVIMLRDNIRDANDALLTLAHEIGGHVAIEEGAKDKGLSLIDTIAEVFKTSKTKDTEQAKTEYRIRRTEGESKSDARATAQEEGMVYGNEYRMPVASPLQKAKTAVKTWMKKHGIDAKMTDEDYIAIAAAGLKRIEQTRTGETNTQTVNGEDVDVVPTVRGTDMANRHKNAQWVSDYYAQREKLNEARAALDAAEAAKRNADAAAKEQAKIDKAVADEEERQKRISEAEQMKKDAEHATKYGREMVADVLNGWYGSKGIKPEQVERIAKGATADEISEILDYIELEMDGKASEGTVLEIAKRVNSDIVKRTVSDKQKAARMKFKGRNNPKAEEKRKRIAAEDKLLEKYINEVQMNPNSMLAFWMHSGHRLFAYPRFKRVANKGKGNGFRFEFDGADSSIDALNALFSNVHGMHKGGNREWLSRLVFGEGATPGEGNGDIVTDEWIRFKRRGIQTSNSEHANGLTNDEIIGDEDWNNADHMLKMLVDEYSAYEEWLKGDRLTAEEKALAEEIEAEKRAMDEDNADISDAQEAWNDAISVSSDGKPISNPDDVSVGDFVTVASEANGEYRVVVDDRNGDLIQFNDGMGDILSYRWNKDKGEWEYVETQKAVDEGGQSGDTSEDRGLPEQQAAERDTGTAGGKDRRDGKRTEASSDNAAASEDDALNLDGGTAKDIADEQKRNRERAEIERRQNAPLKSGTGEVGQSLMDLGGAEGEYLFNRTVAEIRDAAKDGADTKTVWRRLQKAGFKHRTEDEFVRSLREDKFADGETKKVGAQSIVYRAGDKVYKFRDVDGDVKDAVKKIEEFNKLFHDMAYTIRRETMTDNGGKERLVLEQPYVDALPNSGTEARKQLVAALKERFGAENVTTHGDINEKNLLSPKSWFSVDAGPWHIEDLKDLNLGIDSTDGKVKVWDAEISYDAAKDAAGKAKAKWRRIGTREDGVPRYETDSFFRHLTMSEKRRWFKDTISYTMRNRDIVIGNGGDSVVARIEHSDQKKLVGSMKGSSERGAYAKSNLFGERDIEDILSGLSFIGKINERGKSTIPHRSVSEWSYYRGKIEVDGEDFYATAALRKSNGEWNLYDIELNEKPLDLSGGPADLSARGEVGKPISASSVSASSYRSSRPGASSSRLYSVGQQSVGRGENAVAEDNADIIPHSAQSSQDRWRRRTYTPNTSAQYLADLRVKSVTDALRNAKFGADNAALFAAEKAARELAQQGSVSVELRDLINATQNGSVADRAKGNLKAMTSPQTLSRMREKFQDSLISMRELEDRLGIAKDRSVYHQFDRNYGIVTKEVDDLNREIIAPLAKELETNKIPLADFSMLLQALHGPERNRMIAERSPYVQKALNDPASEPYVTQILAGGIDVDDAQVMEICKRLGWVDKNGVITKEGKAFKDDLAGSGATTAYWNGKIDEFRRSGMFAKADKAVKLVRKLTRRNRALLVATGRISSAQASLWAKLSPNYVPLRSDMEMDTNLWSRWFLGGESNRNGGTRSYSDAEYNHAYGRGTLADNPLEFAIQQYHESLQRAYDNVARQRLAEMVRQNPNLGKVFRYEPRMTATKRAHYAKAIAILQNKIAAGTATAKDRERLRWYQEAFNADTNIPLIKVLGANGIVHEMPNLAGLEGTPDKPTQIVAFKEGGELKFIKLGGFAQGDVSGNPNLLDDVSARRIATAVKKQNMARLNAFGKLMRKATGIFSALRTAYSPTFIVSNFGADNTQAARNIYATFGVGAVGKFEHYAFNSFGAAKAVLSGNFGNTKIQQYAKEWYENGGKIGGLAVSNISDLTNEIKRTMRKLNSQKQQLANIHSAKDLLAWATDRKDDFEKFAEYWNSVVEMSTRIAAYATARDMGQSVADAVSYSRDITVNFNRKGTLTPWLNAFYAFSNASIQDLHRSLVAFGEGRVGTGAAILTGRGVKMGVGLAFMGFLASLFGFWQDDPEDEKEGKAQWKYAKDWQKQNTMGVRIGEKVYGVPIRGLSRIPYYFGHQVYEMMTGRKNVVKSAADTVGLAASSAIDFMGQASTPVNTLVPSVLRPGFDIQANKTFTGQQLYREPLPGQEETAVRSEMGRKGTSDAAKWTAKMLNAATGGDEGKRGLIDVQPEKIAAVWDWVFGSAGKDIANITGTTMDIATLNIGNRELRNIPYLSRFARKLDENSADYYEARNEYDKAKKHFSSMAELGNEDKMRSDVEEYPWLSSRGDGKRWGNELKDLDGAVKKLLEIEKSASPEQYDNIHQLRLKTQYQFMRRLNTPPKDDAEGVADEKEHKKTYAPLLRSRKIEEKREKREKEKRRRLPGA